MKKNCFKIIPAEYDGIRFIENKPLYNKSHGHSRSAIWLLYIYTSPHIVLILTNVTYVRGQEPICPGTKSHEETHLPPQGIFKQITTLALIITL